MQNNEKDDDDDEEFFNIVNKKSNTDCVIYLVKSESFYKNYKTGFSDKLPISILKDNGIYKNPKTYCYFDIPCCKKYVLLFASIKRYDFYDPGSREVVIGLIRRIIDDLLAIINNENTCSTYDDKDFIFIMYKNIKYCINIHNKNYKKIIYCLHETNMEKHLHNMTSKRWVDYLLKAAGPTVGSWDDMMPDGSKLKRIKGGLGKNKVLMWSSSADNDLGVTHTFPKLNN